MIQPIKQTHSDFWSSSIITICFRAGTSQKVRGGSCKARSEDCRGGMTEELQKCISGRTEEGFLAGEPARGFGASHRPSGDVRFTGSPARYGARTFGRCFASTLHHRKNIAVQSHTKVSTLNQDLTLFPPTRYQRTLGSHPCILPRQPHLKRIADAGSEQSTRN